MADKYISIYLQDHYAGAVAGAELAKRSLSSNRGGPFEAFLRGLSKDIDEDRRALEDVMRRLGVPTSTVKNSLGWAAEKVGRLKLNGRISGYSPLSRLEEFEALAAGVRTKGSLWRTLLRLSPKELEGVDVDALLKRAEQQVAAIEEQHGRAAEALRAG